MTIDRKLYQKYTGKQPGDAQTRMGESIAKRSADGPSNDFPWLTAYARSRWYVRIGPAILALIGILYFLTTL